MASVARVEILFPSERGRRARYQVARPRNRVPRPHIGSGPVHRGAGRGVREGHGPRRCGRRQTQRPSGGVRRFCRQGRCHPRIPLRPNLRRCRPRYYLEGLSHRPPLQVDSSHQRKGMVAARNLLLYGVGQRACEDPAEPGGQLGGRRDQELPDGLARLQQRELDDVGRIELPAQGRTELEACQDSQVIPVLFQFECRGGWFSSGIGPLPPLETRDTGRRNSSPVPRFLPDYPGIVVRAGHDPLIGRLHPCGMTRPHRHQRRRQADPKGRGS